VTVIQAVVLGVVQGLTEFLPISSSAHLILVRDLLGWEAGSAEIAFDVACHVGTLFAVLIYFREDVARLTVAVPDALAGRPGESARVGRLIVVATVPIALVGWFFGDFVERLRQPAVVAVALAVGALGILVAERVGSHRRTAESLSLLEAVGLGCAQAAALVPGVSRSGAVLTVAMLFGLTRESAARFTFLVGIPAIFAAAIRAAWTQGVDGMAEHTIVLLVGFATSGLVGYLAVTGLLRYIASHSLDLFAYYRLVIAAVLGIWLVAL
jgi:undecaprenyl-diphosphatase